MSNTHFTISSNVSLSEAFTRFMQKDMQADNALDLLPPTFALLDLSGHTPILLHIDMQAQLITVESTTDTWEKIADLKIEEAEDSLSSILDAFASHPTHAKATLTLDEEEELSRWLNEHNIKFVALTRGTHHNRRTEISSIEV